MGISLIELSNVAMCIEEVMPNAKVGILFGKGDKPKADKHYVEVTIEDVEESNTLFMGWYDDIHEAYPVLLGIYYGACLAKDKVFDLSPTPSGADWAE